MNRSRLPLFSVLLLASGLTAVLPAHAVFRCVDEKGITHYGDTMPVQCAKKEISEIAPNGSIVRKIDAQLTPEQIKARDAERAKRAENQRLVAEQKQRDLALLGTYGADREFIASRDRDVSQLDARIKTLQGRSLELDKLVAKYDGEMEFYKSGQSKSNKNAKPREAPPQLINDVARTKRDRAAIDVDIATVEKEKQAIIQRYEGERARWKRLKAGLAVGTILDDAGNITITPNGERRAPSATETPSPSPSQSPSRAAIKTPAKK